jgi:hypothetical protein
MFFDQAMQIIVLSLQAYGRLAKKKLRVATFWNFIKNTMMFMELTCIASSEWLTKA